MTALTTGAAGRDLPAARTGGAPWRAVLCRPVAAGALIYLLVVVAAAVLAPILAPYDPTRTDLAHVLSGPSTIHWVGTDNLGRDVLSRLMYGGQVSLTGVALAVVTALIVGVPVGLTAGYLGGRVDRVVAWLTDMALAIPTIVTLLVVLAVVGSNETAAMIALGLLAAPGMARLVRSATLAVRHELYVAAARVAGAPRRYIIMHEVLPRVAAPIIVQASLFAGAALLTETGLGYLGLGVQPPTPSWGGIVADASTVIDQQPWMLVPSGLTIGLAILALGLLGDAVRDATAEHVRRPVPTPARWAPAPPRPRTTTPTAETAPGAPQPQLAIAGLTVALPSPVGMSRVVEDVDLHILPGETVGLAGESGCGKTMVGRAILGLLPPGGQVTEGSVRYGGADLTTRSPRERRRLRGSQIALIAQEPMTSLDPAFTVGSQLGELVRRHHGGSRRQVRAHVLELLADVKLPAATDVATRYPHQLSGGMAQRVAIALALTGDPKLLIADEPTTALDVTVQADILELLRSLQHSRQMSILLISHDWGVVADLCQRVYVMYAGHVVESGDAGDLFGHPRHPYTIGLLDSSTHGSRPRTRLQAIPGVVPAPHEWPSGCHFRPRCPLATAACAEGPIPVLEPAQSHHTRCIHQDALATGGPK
ncbi:dipeptide/oligopeptide/nickel ABC transporter permease/ATP-binding protein [Amycolatopsis sp. NBC_01488]|uniref:dipeptide/oligopeptide/nickel ABC transporter permease/ATP-binding protein n=1 Tax=Amycolatopsis sp. NBC_01488 TaxID=2903563 RepID=UPI002E29050E|nr:dipeptide/oligopeptide/nickel ABC transporter permease/ATP-binding protein [Amycolatopsis sp. NBC_01488]